MNDEAEQQMVSVGITKKGPFGISSIDAVGDNKQKFCPFKPGDDVKSNGKHVYECRNGLG